MEQETLFGGPPPPPAPPMSADRKRTEARRIDLANGRHPLTKLPLLEQGDHTCGDCAHMLTNYKGFFKCDTYVTNGPGTDVRKSWPACTGWKPVMYPCCEHCDDPVVCAKGHTDPCEGGGPLKHPAEGCPGSERIR